MNKVQQMQCRSNKKIYTGRDYKKKLNLQGYFNSICVENYFQYFSPNSVLQAHSQTIYVLLFLSKYHQYWIILQGNLYIYFWKFSCYFYLFLVFPHFKLVSKHLLILEKNGVTDTFAPSLLHFCVSMLQKPRHMHSEVMI